MYSKTSKHLISLAYITSLTLMGGCAAQATVPAAPAKQAAVSQDTSAPTIPVSAATVVPVKKEVTKPAPLKAGTYASVIKKMNKNRLTLYWRKDGHYSFTIGKSMDAEYKPGVGLTVKSEADSKPITCEFNSSGKLVNKAKAPGVKDQCSKAMFTLDSYLDD